MPLDPNNIETSYINSFREGFEHVFQQRGSRTRPFVNVVSQSAEFDFYDRLGVADDVNEIMDRYGDTPMNEVPHERRRIGLRDFDWAKLVDRKDLLRVLTDPSNNYTQAAVWAFGRNFDRLTFEAAFGPAYVGKDGNRTIDFVGTNAGDITIGDLDQNPDTFEGTTEGIDINASFREDGGSGNTNLTIDKLMAARYTMLEREAIEQDQTVNLFLGSSQLRSLMREEKIQNFDYNTVKALANGEVRTFHGFNFIHTEKVPRTGDIRHCLACLPRAINMAIGQDLTVDVGPRRDKRNIPQIYLAMHFNGSRMWGAQTVKINCDESA